MTDPTPVYEYTDENGNVFQADEETAKRLGWKRVSNKAVTADDPAVNNKAVKK